MLFALALDQINVGVGNVRTCALAERGARLDLGQRLAGDKVAEILRGVEKLINMALRRITWANFDQRIVRRSEPSVSPKPLVRFSIESRVPHDARTRAAPCLTKAACICKSI
jgi:hypothetical protein